MIVTELNISNFRGIENLSFVPNPKLNLFMGSNGTGKTSILKSLSILLSWMVARIRVQNGKGVLVDLDDIRIGGSGCNLSLKLDTCKEGWNLYRNALGAPNDNKLKTSLTDMMRYVREVQEQLEVNAPLVIYYPVTRSVLDIPLRVRKHKFNTLAAYEGALEESKANFRRFFEWYREREDLENEEFRKANIKKLPFTGDSQLKAVRRALDNFFPQFTDLHIQRNPLAMMLDKNGVSFKINQLSDGEKCFIALVADLSRRLAMANPTMDNPLEGRGIVMIDEVDLHLHPNWQMMVIPKLMETFPNCQFFITTHSPQVANHVMAESVFILQSVGNKIYMNRPAFSYGAKPESIYTALMGLEYTRPERVAQDIDELYKDITDKNLEEAKRKLDKLKTGLPSDPELMTAEGLIRRIELIGK